MPVFTTVRGDIFDSGAKALVNPVNCVGVMGAGLAKQFKQRYPGVAYQYEIDCRAGQVRTGQVNVYPTYGPRYIINFPTKRHWQNPSKIEYIESGLKSLDGALAERGISSVAIPALGAGLGGLDWTEVEKLIRSELTGESLSVELYPPR